MAFHNPLHTLSLNEGANVLTLAMADWAILTIDPSGLILPSWRLHTIHDDIIAKHQLRQQDKYQLFACFENTSMWCGFLWGMSDRTEVLFQPDHLETVSLTLEAWSRPSAKPLRYPYQHSLVWHRPSDHSRLALSGWIVEIMLNLSKQEALHFMEILIVDWLHIYPFEELPNNRGQLQTIALRRGYQLWCMAMNFEHCQITSPDDCVRFFSRYQKDESLRRRTR